MRKLVISKLRLGYIDAVYSLLRRVVSNPNRKAIRLVLEGAKPALLLMGGKNEIYGQGYGFIVV
jgi:hypothetical protein